jgi:hypothetical protein
MTDKKPMELPELNDCFRCSHGYQISLDFDLYIEPQFREVVCRFFKNDREIEDNMKNPKWCPSDILEKIMFEY